jgi:hypothetical protein
MPWKDDADIVQARVARLAPLLQLWVFRRNKFRRLHQRSLVLDESNFVMDRMFKSSPW